jgi:uncharacterized ferritin-like protein (DUF455 family)
MTSLRHTALQLLLERNQNQKAALTLELNAASPIDADEPLLEPTGIPGRPAKPELFAKLQTTHLSLRTDEGKAALVHSLTHIELNAIDLALDVIWRFAGMPTQFYVDWLKVAKEEAYHFTLLRDHLQSLGYQYGDFPAHTGLWDMAERTKHNLIARMALVPRTLEARGLDASPAVRAKLVNSGDRKAGKILDIILRDEIGHVAIGNHWYRYLCEQQGHDPVALYPELASQYNAPEPRGPFNLEARRAAGFEEAELQQLLT